MSEYTMNEMQGFGDAAGPSEGLITVVMPLKYYHPEYLGRALRSIIDQTSPGWNLVVAVEAAEAGKIRALLAKELEDPRVALVVNSGHRFPGAINSGVRHATTPFVAILLADDMWAPNAVETLDRYITANPDVDFFHSSRMVVDEDDVPISSIHYSRETFSLKDFRSGSPVKHLLCWRREKGLAIGGIDETLFKAQDDYDFPWTMAEQGATFKAVKECLYLYRNHVDCERLTTHRPLSVTKRGIRGILKKHGVGPFARRWIVARNSWRGSLGAQCLYRNRLEQWICLKLGFDARRGWTQVKYR